MFRGLSLKAILTLASTSMAIHEECRNRLSKGQPGLNQTGYSAEDVGSADVGIKEREEFQAEIPSLSILQTILGIFQRI